MINEMIKEKINKLVKKYKTTDPFILAEYLNIRVVFQDYPDEVNGIYQYCSRTQHIYINNNLSDYEQRSTCAHELGHALLHRAYNCTFLKTYTLLSVTKYELEANIFAAYLLTHDKNLLEFECCTYAEIAATLNIPEQFIKLIK